MGSAIEGPARRSFRLKVEYLERLERSEGGVTAWIPKKVADLMEWHDETLGFTRWVSFSVANLNGDNGDLRRRYDAVISSLQRRGAAGRKPRRGREISHAHALREVTVLAEQNVLLAARVMDLNAEIERRRQYIAILEQRERELIGQLNLLLPLDKRLHTRAAK